MFKTSTHFVGFFNWHLADFDSDDINRDSYALVWWLRNLYRLSTLGIARDVPEFRKAYDYLYRLVISRDILDKQNDMSLRFGTFVSKDSGGAGKTSFVMFSSMA